MANSMVNDIHYQSCFSGESTKLTFCHGVFQVIPSGVISSVAGCNIPAGQSGRFDCEIYQTKWGIAQQALFEYYWKLCKYVYIYICIHIFKICIYINIYVYIFIHMYSYSFPLLKWDHHRKRVLIELYSKPPTNVFVDALHWWVWLSVRDMVQTCTNHQIPTN